VNSIFNTISLEIMKRILYQLFHLYYNKLRLFYNWIIKII